MWDGWTDKQTTRKDRATQLLISESRNETIFSLQRMRFWVRWYGFRGANPNSHTQDQIKTIKLEIIFFFRGGGFGSAGVA